MLDRRLRVVDSGVVFPQHKPKPGLFRKVRIALQRLDGGVADRLALPGQLFVIVSPCIPFDQKGGTTEQATVVRRKELLRGASELRIGDRNAQHVFEIVGADLQDSFEPCGGLFESGKVRFL